MHLAHWFWFALVALFAWGVAGLLWKLSTNHISAESAFIWRVVGFISLLPFIYPRISLAGYSFRSLAWGLSGGVLDALGIWACLVALKRGGKAAIVVPFTSLYVVVVVFGAPIFLHESITWTQGVGVLCALGAVVLLST
jgi:bacterial/archaeal transporter family protein